MQPGRQMIWVIPRKLVKQKQCRIEALQPGQRGDLQEPGLCIL